MSSHRLTAVRCESGSMLPMFGALVFIAVLVIALVVDIALLQVTFRRTASIADHIAEGAAAMFDVGHLRDHGVVELDPMEAARAAVALATDQGVSDRVTVEVVDGRICVELRDQYEVVATRVISGDSIPVVVRSCAEPRAG